MRQGLAHAVSFAWKTIFFFTDVLKGPPLPVYSTSRAESSARDTGVIKETTIPLVLA